MKGHEVCIIFSPLTKRLKSIKTRATRFQKSPYSEAVRLLTVFNIPL